MQLGAREVGAVENGGPGVEAGLVAVVEEPLGDALG